MKTTSWLLRLPGLRRLGLEAAVARRRADELSARVHRLKARQLSPTVLQHLIRVRHEALVARTRACDAAARRDEHFRRCSPAYADALARAGEPLPASSTRTVSIEGLLWHVPVYERAGDDLAGKVVEESWLPLRRLLATRDVAVGTAMLDIGANIGTTSVPRVILGDFQYIYAAEPDPANYQCLARNVIDNGLRGLVLPDRLAIGAEDGTTILHRAEGIGQHRVSAIRQSARDVDVPCLTLDSWIARCGIDPRALAFVKVDTQGSEVRVLRGAPKLLAQPQIAWQLEFSPALLTRAGTSAADLIELMERHFTWFIDVQAHTAPRTRPVSDLREALGSLPAGRFTDVVLYNTAAR